MKLKFFRYDFSLISYIIFQIIIIVYTYLAVTTVEIALLSSCNNLLSQIRFLDQTKERIYVFKYN